MWPPWRVVGCGAPLPTPARGRYWVSMVAFALEVATTRNPEMSACGRASAAGRRVVLRTPSGRPCVGPPPLSPREVGLAGGPRGTVEALAVREAREHHRRPHLPDRPRLRRTPRWALAPRPGPGELADPLLELPALSSVGAEALFVLGQHRGALVGAHRPERRVALLQPGLVLTRLGARRRLLLALLAAAPRSAPRRVRNPGIACRAGQSPPPTTAGRLRAYKACADWGSAPSSA